MPLKLHSKLALRVCYKYLAYFYLSSLRVTSDDLNHISKPLTKRIKTPEIDLSPRDI